MIPVLTKSTIDNYVDLRIRPGGFVTAVLENDLMTAVARADSVNRPMLSTIVQYVVNEVPVSMWGSKEIVEKHLNRD